MLFGSTFAFFANAQTNAKKCKRATKPTHNDTHQNEQTSKTEKRAADNMGLAKVGL